MKLSWVLHIGHWGHYWAGLDGVIDRTVDRLRNLSVRRSSSNAYLPVLLATWCNDGSMLEQVKRGEDNCDRGHLALFDIDS